MTASIAILDYDMANLRSVQKALEVGGHSARIIREPREIADCDKLILPGVGAFGDAMQALHSRGLVEPILTHARSGKPLLGICLGLQLLFDVSYENGEHKGLGLLAGKILRFDVDVTHKLKVPHMGWNTLSFPPHSPRAPIFATTPENAGVYFTHSYYVQPADAGVIAATADYGRPFTAAVWSDNIQAVQFHPEKSQKVGLAMLHAFAETA